MASKHDPLAVSLPAVPGGITPILSEMGRERSVIQQEETRLRCWSRRRSMRRLATQLALIACFVPFFAAFCGVLWVF